VSLRKSPTMTPARLEANRRNARKSTGPRTAQGKSQSRLNSLREGNRSALMRDAVLAFLQAPPYSVEQVALAILTPAQTSHPLFADIVEIARWAEGGMVIPSNLSSVAATRKKKFPPFFTGEA
jgi:hypothetical protein